MTKDFLLQAFVLDRQIKAKQEQIQKLRDMQLEIQSTLLDKGIKKNNNNILSASLTSLVDEYVKDVTKLLTVKYEIKNYIDQVGQADYRVLLSLRYESLFTWEVIAEKMNYHVTYIYKLHHKALRSIEDNAM